jgi:hypothetical protein
MFYICTNAWGKPLLIDIVNKCPAARAEKGSSAPAAED